MPELATRVAEMPTLHHWIGGQAAPSSGTQVLPVFNPSSSAQIAQVLCASSADVTRAVVAAAEAYPDWASRSPSRRARIMFRFKELLERDAGSLAAVVSCEHGKTIVDASAEIARGIEVVEFACGAPALLQGDFSHGIAQGLDCYSFRQPLGVVVGITPFNFPVMVPLWMAPLALVCGNSFILKPSERTPSAALRLGELLHEAGLPAGVFNVVQGERTAVEALIEHPHVKALSFVGSTAVARRVHEMGTRAGKRVQALGGAKNHLVVMPDADIDSAVEALVTAAFGSAGERCMAISVAVPVGESTAEALRGRLLQRLSQLRIGVSDDPRADMGPLVTAEHRERVQAYIAARMGRHDQTASGREKIP